MATINWTNVSTAQDFLQAPNTASGDFFWTAILLMVMVVMLISMINFGFEIALLVVLFFGILIGIPLMYLGLINTTVVGIIVGIFLFMIIYFVTTNKRN